MVHPPTLYTNGKVPTLNPFVFVDYDALMVMDLPPQKWVIENVLPVGLLSSITAESGAGKTWLALMLMRAIASGGLWAGKYQCQQLTCGLLDLEGSYGRVKDRLRSLEVGVRALPVEVRQNMRFLSDLGRINIVAAETQQQVTAAVQQRGIQVLFVDTLVRTHMIEENSADMSLVMEALERIARDTPCTVVTLHHAGKGSNGKPATSGRGSSAIKAALQHEIMLTRETDKTIKVSLTKAKSAPEVDRLTTMTIQSVEGGVSIEFTDEEISVKEPGRPSAREARQKAALALLTDRQLAHKALIDGVMATAKCGRSTAKDEIAEMLKDELICKKGELYCLPDEV